MTRPPATQSCCTTPSAICFWVVMFGLFYGAGLLLTLQWPGLHRFAHTMILTALAAACVANFRRNRTLHCAVTGPLFGVGAIVALVTEAGVWEVDQNLFWGVMLVGVALAFVVEWRTVGRRSQQSGV